ncbi:MAG: hypothetical protein K2O92_01170 [Lachnospiraceae bacterium]|nr:hypothetical protein [Lachnospiraceae bacterium]
MNFKITKQWIKKVLLMIISVMLMGFCVSLLVLTDMGTDPCSAMNYGVSAKVGMSFGNYQLLLNIVLLVFVFIFDRSLIGAGTIGNMVLVGYTADFFSNNVWDGLLHIPVSLPLVTRICILIPSLILFVTAAACYMNSGCGIAPYDAVSFIINAKLEKALHKENLFKFVRLLFDLCAMLIGVATKGETGIITALMVISLGPAVSYVGELFKKRGFLS